jgi:hypothetical protein
VQVNEFVRQISGFGGWLPTDQIAWFVHAHRAKNRFTAADIRACYDECGMSAPAISALINNLVVAKRPQILSDSRGFRLERSVREKFDSEYGQRAITVEVHKTLLELPSKVPNLAERAYLEESLKCVRCEAYRAAIVMCWNVAYDHLCMQILNHHLAPFNAKMVALFPKEKTVVADREDFFEFNEARVLEVCRAAAITDKNVHGVLEASLKVRNRAAHASGSVFKQPQAENYILELINNALLKL